MAQEHSFSTPSPAGLAALAVAVFGFAPVFLGWVGPSSLPLLAAWLIGGFIVQIIVAIVELKDHNITGGNVFLFFCAFFMLAAAISTLAKWYMISFMFTPEAVKAALASAATAAGVKPDMLTPEQVKAAMAGVGPAVGAMMHKAVYIEGWMWMAGAAFLTVVTPAYAKSSSLFFFTIILVDIVLWLIVGADTGWFVIGTVKTSKMIIGYGMIVIGWIGLYFAGATLCNTVYGRTIFPVPKPLIK
jgi:succinate-acetate transporter protein